MLIIKTFGEFSLTYNEKVITEKDRRSKKMWLLLKYLITFRERDIPQDELVKLLWPDGECVNPNAALKTQLHRLRATLDTLGMPESEEIIVSSTGAYAFNNLLEYTIDIAEFDELSKAAMQASISEKERTNYIRKAFDLYNGDFFHKIKNEQWITHITLSYHSMFLKISHMYIDILYRHKQYNELLHICKKIIMIDNCYIEAHYILIKTLLENKETQAAKRHYNYVTDLFFNQLGIAPGNQFVSLYEEIIKSELNNETDLIDIKKHLKEEREFKKEKDGAFYCEPELFKYIYRLELRECIRRKHGVYICMISISNSGNDCGDDFCKAMKQMFASISSSLRMSDIFTRFSSTQFLILLTGTSFENSNDIIKRIINYYESYNINRCFKPEYAIENAVD